MYDVIIIGAGVIGTSVARELAKYKAKILLLDKESDVGNGTSMANSAIVHSGYDPKFGTNKAKHNAIGNGMYDLLCKELDVEFKRIGSLTCATNKEELDIITSYVDNALKNGVEVQILNKEQTKKIEPFISDDVIGALYAPSAGIINPFELCVALAENAVDNGVELLLNEEVTEIRRLTDRYIVKTKNKEFECKMIVNSAGVYSDEICQMNGIDFFKINPRKGEYFVLDHFNKEFIKHVIFPCPSEKGKGILITPTTHGNYLVGPSSEYVDSKNDVSTDKITLDIVKNNASKLVKNIPFNYIIRQFSGLRATSSTHDFIIENRDDMIILGGIESPGLASAPSIAKEAVTLVNDRLNLLVNEDFNPFRKKVVRLREMSIEERNEIIRENKQYGHIVCRCEGVSEGEVVDCIRRNAGARTVKGVKKRCRPGFGKCQGGFCEPLIVEILARELNIDPLQVKYDSKQSYIVQSKTKEAK